MITWQQFNRKVRQPFSQSVEVNLQKVLTLQMMQQDASSWQAFLTLKSLTPKSWLKRITLTKSFIANNHKLMVMHGTNSKLTELLTKLLEESSDTSKTTGQFYFLTNDLYQMISKSQNGWMIAKNFTPSLMILRLTCTHFLKETNRNLTRLLLKPNRPRTGWQDRMLLVLGWVWNAQGSLADLEKANNR